MYIITEHPNIQANDIIKNHMKKIYDTLDQLIDSEELKHDKKFDIVPERKYSIDEMCKKVKKCSTPLMYALKNINKFKQSLDKKLYNDYADMKNRGENHALIK